MKKNNKIIILLISMMIFLVGWKIKPVELLSKDKLIDLQLTIKEAPPGKPGNPDLDNTADSEEESEEENSSISIVENQTQTTKNTQMEIVICDTEVKFGGNNYNLSNENGIDSFQKAVIKNNDSDMEFILVDAYAEAHIYRTALKCLEDLKNTHGVKYSVRTD